MRTVKKKSTLLCICNSINFSMKNSPYFEIIILKILFLRFFLLWLRHTAINYFAAVKKSRESNLRNAVETGLKFSYNDCRRFIRYACATHEPGRGSFCARREGNVWHIHLMSNDRRGEIVRQSDRLKTSTLFITSLGRQCWSVPWE